MDFIKDGRYPITLQDIYRENPQTSFPAGFDPKEFGYDPVVPVALPVYDAATQTVAKGAPVLTNGKWYETYTVVNLSADTIAANQLRAKEQLITAVTQATQNRLDTFAKTRNYDGILSACTYANSTVTKFQTEGQYCVNARDATWATLYTIMAEVEAGTRPMPSGFADIEADLPVLAWPT